MMDILSPVCSTRLALVLVPDHKKPISIKKPFLGFPRNPSASDPYFCQRTKKCKTIVPANLKAQYLACITSSVGVNPLPILRSSLSPSPVRSPLFWIGVGVGLSVAALYSWVTSRIKIYVKEQALKTLAGQMNTENFNNALQKVFSIADEMLSSNNSAIIDIKDNSEPRVCSVVHVSPEETDQEAVIDDHDHVSPRAVEVVERVLGDPAVQTVAMDVINKFFTAL